jgi:hypothetical protein
MDLRRAERRRILALSRDAVATVPRGTVILAPERAGEVDQRWQVDGIETMDADQVQVIVVPAPEVET